MSICLVKIWGITIYELLDDTKDHPSLPKAKPIFQASTMDTEQAYLISQKNPWKPQIAGINSHPTLFNSWNNVNNKFHPK